MPRLHLRDYFRQWEKTNSNSREEDHRQEYREDHLLKVDRHREDPHKEDPHKEDHPADLPKVDRRRRHRPKSFWSKAWMWPLTFCTRETRLDCRTRARICVCCGPG